MSASYVFASLIQFCDSDKQKPVELKRCTTCAGNQVRRKGKMAKLGRSANGHSERRACMTSMRAARAAGSQEATTAAASSTNAERATGKAPGIFTSKK